MIAVRKQKKIIKPAVKDNTGRRNGKPRFLLRSFCSRITPYYTEKRQVQHGPGVYYSLSRGGGISGYTFSSHCAPLKGVQWPWSESRIVSTAQRNSSLRFSLPFQHPRSPIFFLSFPSLSLPCHTVSPSSLSFSPWLLGLKRKRSSVPMLHARSICPRKRLVNPRKPPEIPRNPREDVYNSA